MHAILDRSKIRGEKIPLKISKLNGTIGISTANRLSVSVIVILRVISPLFPPPTLNTIEFIRFCAMTTGIMSSPELLDKHYGKRQKRGRSTSLTNR